MENSLPSAPHLRANWLSITGSVRDHNEDAVGIAFAPGAPAQFFVLCDGVGGGIVQATEDHSTASTMMLPSIKTDGTIKRNVLMRGIGKGAAIDPDLLLLQLQPGDKLLLCSDGMSDRITAEEIAHTLGTMALESAPDFLAQTADGRMSKDNISIIIIEVSEAPVTPLRLADQERAFVGYNPRWGAVPFAPAGIAGAGSRQRPLLFGLVAVAVMAALIVVLLAFGNRGGSGGTAQAQDGPTAPVVQATAASTDTPSPTPSATLTPSLTHTPTPTPSATPTPIPPTATLRSSG